MNGSVFALKILHKDSFFPDTLVNARALLNYPSDSEPDDYEFVERILQMTLSWVGKKLYV